MLPKIIEKGGTPFPHDSLMNTGCCWFVVCVSLKIIYYLKEETNMNVKFENNVLTVVTDISKATIEKGLAALSAKDEKGNELYRVVVSTSGNGNLDTYGMKVNTFVEDKAAVTVILPMGVTKEQVQGAYGEALIAAAKYTGTIAAAAAEKEAAIEAFFA